MRQPVVLYTDGSCVGHKDDEGDNRSAGVGVWYGHNDPRNVSAPLGPGRQTNQRAELKALLIAIQSVEIDIDLEIMTDSMYTIECICRLWNKWVFTCWKKRHGEVRPNEDIIRPILAIKDQRDRVGTMTKLTWVKGHSGIEGNEQADILARRGAGIDEEESDRKRERHEKRVNRESKKREAAHGQSARQNGKKKRNASAQPVRNRVNNIDMEEVWQDFLEMCRNPPTRRSILNGLNAQPSPPASIPSQSSQSSACKSVSWGGSQVREFVSSSPPRPL